MARKIAYIGFGALGIQVSTLVNQQDAGPVEETFFDDTLFKSGAPGSFALESYRDDQFSDFEFLICLGYKNLSKKNEIIRELKSLKRKISAFAHSSCIVNPTAVLETGTILYQGCNIDQDVIVKSGALLNNGVIISHGSIVGNSSFLAPGVILSGNVTVGDCTFIGAGSVISNNIHIGSNVIIGPSTSVTRDIPTGQSAIGNPMRILDKSLKLS